MKIYLRKAVGKLEPSLPEDEIKLSKWKFGDVLCVEVKKPRNGKFHKKFFALLHVVFGNQDKYSNMEDLLTEIKLKTGHYTEHITTKGIVVYIPKSISFAKMDELQFQMFYSKVIDVVLRDFLPMDKNDLDSMVNEVLSFT